MVPTTKPPYLPGLLRCAGLFQRSPSDEQAGDSADGNNVGVYLRDLDPDLAAEYLGRARIDAPVDSPSPRESTDSGTAVKAQLNRKKPRVMMSLCGLDDIASFDKKRIDAAQFKENPAVFGDPDLVVWINGRVYNWQVASPIIMSLVAFGQ